MSLESNGWLLKLRGQLRAAVGLRELVHVLPHSPRLYPVPQTPPHARHVILWEGKILPVVDLAAYLEAGVEDDMGTATKQLSLDHLVGIVAYQTAPATEVSLAGMLLGKVPERIRVTDDQACALPQGPAGWQQVAISCFEHPAHGAVPILDLPRLFSGRLSMTAASAAQAWPDYELGYRLENSAAGAAPMAGADEHMGPPLERAALAAGAR
jgi:chemotaxis signal transduction protein